MMRALLTILIFVLLGTGCRPDITCADLGCAYGESCNTSSGKCEPQVFDCRLDRDSCAADELCDDTNGVCRSESLRCAEGNPCPTDLVCDESSGFCRPLFRCSIDGCASSEVCDQESDRCVPKPCNQDSECPEQFICTDKVCDSGCRPGENTCPTGEACFFQTGDDFGQCQGQCQTDFECPFGQFCLSDSSGSTCTLEEACAGPADCRSDEVCNNSVCSQPPCAMDEDCLESQLCDVSTGSCLTASCEEDIYGGSDTTPANHRFEFAYPLSPQQDCPSDSKCLYDDLTICPGRSDWFSLNVESSNLITILVEQAAATPDLDVFVYDSQRRLLGQNRQLGLASKVRFASELDQVIFVEIRAAAVQTAKYSLTVVNEFCAEDSFEENDSPNSPTTLASAPNSPSEFDANSCGLDEDWYRIAGLDADLGLRIEKLGGGQDLEFTILSPEGGIVSVPEAGTTMLRVGHAGDYLLQVQSAFGQGGPYRIGYEVLPPWNCPEANLHNTFDLALQAGLSPYQGVICPVENAWEVDWIKLPALGDGVLTIEVNGQDAPPLSLSLFEHDPTRPTLIRSGIVTGGKVTLGAIVSGAERYLIRVSSDEHVGRIIQEPAYSVSFSLTP